MKHLTPQNTNHLRSHSGRIICDRQVLYKILPTNLGESINLACSAGVSFFGRANVLLVKAHVETLQEGRKLGESKGAG